MGNNILIGKLKGVDKNMNEIIERLNELSAYNDIDISKRIIDVLSEIFIDNQFMDFKFVVEKFNDGIYVIYNICENVMLKSWYIFCMDMIKMVENTELDFSKLLKVVDNDGKL